METQLFHLKQDATIDAVGSVIKAIDGIEQKKFKNAFCPVRPPGHHAEKKSHIAYTITQSQHNIA